MVEAVFLLAELACAVETLIEVAADRRRPFVFFVLGEPPRLAVLRS